MPLIMPIHNLPRRRDNLHRARRVAMTAQRDGVVFGIDFQLLAAHGCDAGIIHLRGNVLLRLLGCPRFLFPVDDELAFVVVLYVAVEFGEELGDVLVGWGSPFFGLDGVGDVYWDAHFVCYFFVERAWETEDGYAWSTVSCERWLSMRGRIPFGTAA